MRFFASDAGGASGGSSGAAQGGASGQSGGSGGGQQQQTTPFDIKEFDKLPWDELDDDSKATLTRLKEGAVATLQQFQTTSTKAQEAEERARRFQSDFDRLKAEKEKAEGKGGGSGTEDDPYLTAVSEELRSAGYSAEDSTKLAPVFAGMFKRIGSLQKGEIGKSLAPMAQTVLAGQAQDAWFEALTNDRLGMFENERVQKEVWDLVRQRVEANAETTSEIILNLAKMSWADVQAEERAGGGGGGGSGGGGGAGGGNGGGNRGVLPATPPNMRTGGGTGGGGGSHLMPIASRVADPNAPRTQLNEDTRMALAVTFKNMTAGTKIVPTELKDAMAPTRRGGRQ